MGFAFRGNGATVSSVDSAAIQDRTIQATDIALGAVTASELAAGSVTKAKIAAGAVGNTELAASAVGTANIAAGAVNAAAIATDAVGADEIAAGAVGTTELAASAVGTANIAAGAVTDEKIGGVSGGKVAAGTLPGDRLADSGVTLAKLAGNVLSLTGLDAAKPLATAVPAGTLFFATDVSGGTLYRNSGTTWTQAASSIGAAGVADGSISTLKLADLAVTGAKIAADTIDASKIAPDAVGSSELAGNAVDSPAIQDGAVTDAKRKCIEVTTLPVGPVDGDVILYAPDTTRRWRLVFDATLGKWTPLGAHPLTSVQGVTTMTAGTGYAKPIGSPDVTIPAAGIYGFAFGARLRCGAGIGCLIALKQGTSAPIDSKAAEFINGGTVVGVASVSNELTGTTLAAGDVVELHIANVGGSGAPTVERAWLRVTPIQLNP